MPPRYGLAHEDLAAMWPLEQSYGQVRLYTETQTANRLPMRISSQYMFIVTNFNVELQIYFFRNKTLLILFKYAYGLSAVQDGCLLDRCHSISMPANLLPLNPAYLLVLCFSICYTCLYGVSLWAVPARTVAHYKPLGTELQCFLKVKDDLSYVLKIQHVTLNV